MRNYKQILEAVHRGIKLALDDYQDIEPNSSISQTNDVIDVKDVIQQRIDLNDYVVDLGLPSGTLWCKYNLGVDPNKLNTNISWYGKYYSWGEIKNKKQYLGSNYKFKKYNDSNIIILKYNNEDKLIQLLPEDDAALQNMHLYNYKFHIPTKKQFEELLAYTTQEPVKNYKNIKKLNGFLFIGKNGNQIFFPNARTCNHFGFRGVAVSKYWTSNVNLNDCRHAWGMVFYKDINMAGYCDRADGGSIRPVLNLK